MEITKLRGRSAVPLHADERVDGIAIHGHPKVRLLFDHHDALSGQGALAVEPEKVIVII